MTAFRALPFEVQAVQYVSRESLPAMEQLAPGLLSRSLYITEDLYLITPHGTIRLDFGDYVVKYATGQVYPMRPQIFQASFGAAT